MLYKNSGCSNCLHLLVNTFLLKSCTLHYFHAEYIHIYPHKLVWISFFFKICPLSVSKARKYLKWTMLANICIGFSTKNNQLFQTTVSNCCTRQYIGCGLAQWLARRSDVRAGTGSISTHRRHRPHAEENFNSGEAPTRWVVIMPKFFLYTTSCF